MQDFLGVYIHIPFCTSICSYCDFCKIYYDKIYIDRYLNNLDREIRERYKGEIVNSIYIGGGTPTSLDYQELKRLLDITRIFNTNREIEFTIESNIDSIDDDKIGLLKSYNVNRVSLGVQSFDSKCLEILKRTHNKKQAIDIIRKLKTNGLTNINIDIIYGIIDDMGVVEEDINTFLELEIPHISCYSLIVENNTMLSVNNYKNIDEDIEYRQYKFINNMLSKNNYYQYEISNYCKEGYESLHNINYWNNGNYYGFGLSSVSFINNYRVSNTRNLSRYLKGHYIDSEVLEDKDTRMSNTMILGLRKIEGVNRKSFYYQYQEKIEDVFEIDDLIRSNKLIDEDGFLRISCEYLYLSNEILLRFLERK